MSQPEIGLPPPSLDTAGSNGPRTFADPERSAPGARNGTYARAFEAARDGVAVPSDDLPTASRLTPTQTAVAGGLLLAHAAAVAFLAAAYSPTLLEPAFLAAGVSHWERGDFDLYRVNPPLVRLLAGLPAVVGGCRTDWRRYASEPGSRAEYPVGADFVAANGDGFPRLLFLGRLACLPFTLVGAYFTLRWATELYGGVAGLAALALWVTDPNLTAHAALITSDVACTAFGVAACYWYWRWLGRFTWPSALLSGLFLGLTLASKFSWLILVPVWSGVTLGALLSRRAAPAGRLRPACQFGVALVVAAYLVNVCYGFDGSFTRLRDHRFVSAALTGGAAGVAGNRFADSAVGGIPVPLPRSYLEGIDLQKKDFEHYGRPSYLNGTWREQGWWYYYLFGLLAKCPLSTLGLVAVAGASQALRLVALPNIRDAAALLLPPAVLFVLVSSQSEFSHHFRYVLPCLPFLFLYGSQAAAVPLGPRMRTRAGLVLALPAALPLVVGVASSLAAYPHHLSYFNELVGGSRAGHRYMLGSSLDWGQDAYFLRRWMADHPDRRVVYCGVLFHWENPAAGPPVRRPGHGGVPYVVVSRAFLEGERTNLTNCAEPGACVARSLRRLAARSPGERIGGTLLAYRVTPGFPCLEDTRE